jgi:hypothetical protein
MVDRARAGRTRVDQASWGTGSQESFACFIPLFRTYGLGMAKCKPINRLVRPH